MHNAVFTSGGNSCIVFATLYMSATLSMSANDYNSVMNLVLQRNFNE